MPGAFAHITLVNEASSLNNLKSIALNEQALDAILSWLEYIELGAVSPDYPYLALGEEHKYWADCIHVHYKTREIVFKGIEELRKIQDGEEKDKVFSWLCGFVAHIITDSVIHPVVEKKVGHYVGNEKKHRICEMHQDAYIYKRLNLGQIGMAEHLKSGIKTCHQKENEALLYIPVKTVWKEMLKSASPEEYAKNEPDVDTWHKCFYTIVNAVEEGYKLFPLARHITIGAGLTYPVEDAIEEDEYIKNLAVPFDKTMDYDVIFDKAIHEVLQSWKILGDAAYGNDNVYMAYFKNWNLDNGKDTNDTLTYWA